MCAHNAFIHCKCTVILLFFLLYATVSVCMYIADVCACVCAQPPKWNTAPERDWNQYFLLRHLSHLYKAETIWTPVYSTLPSFIKLPHLAKTRTHACTHARTHTRTPMQHAHTSCVPFVFVFEWHDSQSNFLASIINIEPIPWPFAN